MKNMKTEHEYIDLGLPSGTLWATCNVGASKPEEYGDYFAWGETTPKSYYGWSTYKYGTVNDALTKYCYDSDYGKDGYTDTKTVLDAEDDAATANWGKEWRMPTLAEIKELKSCINTWTTQNGMYGCKFTGTNGNSIFLPVSGYYDEGNLYNGDCHGLCWSSTLDEGGTDGAYGLYCNSVGVSWYGYNYRNYGLTIRPVRSIKNKFKEYNSCNMTYDEFYKDIINGIKEYPSELRLGQSIYNYIHEKHGIARNVVDTYQVDCFYDDTYIKDFIDKAYEIYNKETIETKNVYFDPCINIDKIGKEYKITFLKDNMPNGGIVINPLSCTINKF